MIDVLIRISVLLTESVKPAYLTLHRQNMSRPGRTQASGGVRGALLLKNGPENRFPDTVRPNDMPKETNRRTTTGNQTQHVAFHRL